MTPKHDADLLKQIRAKIIEMAGHSAHVAPALSCVEILTALYFEVLQLPLSDSGYAEGDHFIMSKGHGCMALYAVLEQRGIIEAGTTESYGQNGSRLGEHPLAGKVSRIDYATGSLGHGLAVAAGLAKSAKILDKKSRFFVLMGDGECDEGSVWEAAAISSHHNLDNLTAIVDMNGFQACGRCQEISGPFNLVERWKAFGWQVDCVDGHDYKMLCQSFKQPNETNKPRVVLCSTVKGKGIDFMENNLEWHYRPVRGQDKIDALRKIQDA